MAYANLSNAKRAKNDEFYTQLSDIENELKHYKSHFAGKVVYCNCDDARKSNFFRFFQKKFNDYGLKKLITTSYNENGHGSVLVYEGDTNGTANLTAMKSRLANSRAMETSVPRNVSSC